MDDPATIIPKRASTPAADSARRTGFGIPADLLAKARRRLALFWPGPGHQLLYQRSGELTITTTAHVLIVAYPLIVPGPPFLTLLAAVAATLSVPASFLVLELVGEISISPVAYVAPSMFVMSSGALAIIGSRVIYGISRDVARSREMGSYQLESLFGKGGMGEVWTLTRAQNWWASHSPVAVAT